MRRTLLVVLSISLLVSIASGGYVWWVWNQIDAIPRFAPTPTTIGSPSPSITPVTEPSATDPVSILVFSIGSKGLDAEDAERTGVGGARSRMADGLTDTVMLILLNPSGRAAGIISIPRDTLVESSGRRINEAYNTGGVTRLVDQIEELTGIRADHQVALNFAAFADLTTAVGGVDIQVDDRVVDKKSKLFIDYPGCVHLEGADALAFARSRHWLVVRPDGTARADATSSDWGRIERQQAIIRALAEKLLKPSLVTQIPDLLGIAQKNLVLNEELSTTTLLSLARAYSSGSLDIVATTIPGTGRMLNGASVIVPDTLAAWDIVSEIGLRVGYTQEALGDDLTEIPSTETATSSASPVEPSAKSTQNRWVPDRGVGNGGKKYPTCSPGHLPHD